MEDIIDNYITDHPKAIVFYQLSLGSGDKAFTTFTQFYTALMTIPNALCEHYSLVRYTDTNDITGTFKLRRDGIFTKSTSTKLAEIKSENRSYTVDIVAIESVRHEPYSIDDFELKRTDLLELWEFRIDSVLYILEKLGTGITKMHASNVEPIFQIRIKHYNMNTIYDLFGKHSDKSIGKLNVHNLVST